MKKKTKQKKSAGVRLLARQATLAQLTTALMQVRPGNFVIAQLGWRIRTVSLIRMKRCSQEVTIGACSLRWARDSFRMRASATRVPFPTSLKPSYKGVVTLRLAGRRTPPSCSRSSIRSQSPWTAHRWSEPTAISPGGFWKSAQNKER